MFDFAGLGSVADVPRFQARANPGLSAQIFEGRTTTYAEFDRNTNRVAQGLLLLGLEPGARVGYLGKNSDLFFELLFGAAKARCVMVGVNWRLALPEMQYILNDSGCEVLVVGTDHYDLVRDLRAACTGLKAVLGLDGAPEFPLFGDWRDSQVERDPLLQAPADDDVIQLYTSGTTGHPKGVQISNANYLSLWQVSQDAGWADFAIGDVSLVCMPVFHIAGTNMGVLTLAQGGTSIIMREVDPGLILEFVPKYRINHLFAVPAVILFMLQHPRSAATDFSSLKRLSYGASPIAEDLLRKAKALFGCPFVQLYGLTETTGGGAYLPDEAHDPARGKLRACGIPYPGIEIRIVDGAGTSLPPREVGEIVIKSGVIMKGYWNNAEATAKAIIDGWFYTGDAGYFDEDGYLYIHDRVKDMIVSGGENIYPAEVENAVFGHPAVADVAVIGVPDEKWGEAVKVIVVLKPGVSATGEEIMAFARSRIAGYKVPKSVDFASVLPRNPSGKILRRELREPYWLGRERRVN
ncbi:MAG: long-chain-fatty-acid--CoA ligase [Gammaproteobacteria bacterium]|nr:long-chain-fatty-acid--CoA ligase [Gammaproteobacteria bacterium]